MTPEALRGTLSDESPPQHLPACVQALWWDARVDWEKAHASAMGDQSAAGSAVHAYLHRKEGDAANAAYWYRRAGRPAATGSFDEEWAALAAEFLAAG